MNCYQDYARDSIQERECRCVCGVQRKDWCLCVICALAVLSGQTADFRKICKGWGSGACRPPINCRDKCSALTSKTKMQYNTACRHCTTKYTLCLSGLSCAGWIGCIAVIRTPFQTEGCYVYNRHTIHLLSPVLRARTLNTGCPCFSHHAPTKIRTTTHDCAAEYRSQYSQHPSWKRSRGDREHSTNKQVSLYASPPHPRHTNPAFFVRTRCYCTDSQHH